MSNRTMMTVALGCLCSCGSVVRATKLELVDADGSTIAELGRTDGKTSLRFYEYQGGTKCTTIELESRVVDVSRLDGELVATLKKLGYGVDQVTTATSRITLASRNGRRTELSNDGVVFYGNDGSVLWVVSVATPPDAPPTMELYNGDGKAVFSTTTIQ